MINVNRNNNTDLNTAIPSDCEDVTAELSEIPFTAAELSHAQQLAHKQTLEKVIRLCAWESLPHETRSFGQQEQVKSIAMWVARQVVSWTVQGDEFDLFASIQLNEPSLSQLSSWLELWEVEGIDRDSIKRFSVELANSIRNEAIAICFRERWNQQIQKEIGSQSFWQGLRGLETFVENPTLFFEQWGAIGHPIHPTIKAKQGVSAIDVFETAPEFRGRAQISIAAIKRDQCVLEGGEQDEYLDMLTCYFPELIERWQFAMGENAHEYLPLPVHPVQIESRWNKEIHPALYLPEAAPKINSHASLSYRTVYPEGGPSKPFIKLPVAMRMTSTQRTVSPRSSQMGPRVSKLLLEINARDNALQQSFTPLPETWGLHLDASAEVAKHFSVIFRSPLSEVLDSEEMAIPVAALAARTPDEKCLFSHILTDDAHDIGQLMPNFRSYVQHLINAALGLYLKYGITLEAHQQNSLLKLDSQGQIAGFIIRDFGGVRIHPDSLLKKGLKLAFHPDPLILAEDRSQCRQKLIHTLYICHIGALVSALSSDYSIPSSWLWRVIAEETKKVFNQCRPAMAPLDYVEDWQGFLQVPWQTKAFIRMRLKDTSEDIWTHIGNPLKPWS